MKQFTVTLTVNNNSGPFNIYYIDPTGTYIALKASDLSQAIDISAAELTSGLSIYTVVLIYNSCKYANSNTYNIIIKYLI